MPRLSRVCAVMAGLIVTGCGRSPTTPDAPRTSSGPSVIDVQVLSGVTQQPVAGAHVTFHGAAYTTDADGRAELSGGQGDIQIVADGYLQRTSTVGSSTRLTLWPVASDAEADAVHDMVFDRRGGVLYPFDTLYLTIPTATPDVLLAWGQEAVRFASQLGISYQGESTFQYEVNEVEVLFGANQGCTPSPALGFCRANQNYMVVAVSPDRATDPATIDRVLAQVFLLAPNPLPGLLNADSPAGTFSPFELQTMHMILQRPYQTRWPDDDRH
jgi:hypothetical protein